MATAAAQTKFNLSASSFEFKPSGSVATPAPAKVFVPAPVAVKDSVVTKLEELGGSSANALIELFQGIKMNDHIKESSCLRKLIALIDVAKVLTQNVNSALIARPLGSLKKLSDFGGGGYNRGGRRGDKKSDYRQDKPHRPVRPY